MSSATSTTSDPTRQSATSQAPSKKKNNKKKKDNKPKPVDLGPTDGTKVDNEDMSDEPDTPGANAPEDTDASTTTDPSKAERGTNGHAQPRGVGGGGGARERGEARTAAVTGANGHPVKPQSAAAAATTDDMSAKLEAMTQERDALRAEVEQLRKQLQSIGGTQDSEAARLRTELEESEAAREQAEEQYQNLLGRVEKIKETLGERLKRDKEELAEAKGRVEELESQNEELLRAAEESGAEAGLLREELREAEREASQLRSRNNLSQQSWLKERDDMSRQLASCRAELERMIAEKGDWEVVAMEARAVRDSLGDKVSDLEEQAASLREAYERAASERDTQAQAIDNLQRALREIQEARKRELRHMVESSEEQLESMKQRVQEASRRADEAEAARAELEKELERTTPFEKEVKEKNLLIGKLRHEAIALNDHLTRALKYIKKNRPEDNVDRQVVTNLFLQFLALDRSDPKKFQVLQVISGLLNWSEEQKEQAGLARPGTSSSSSLRLPQSPFHRTPSTPSLNTEFFSDMAAPGSTSKESLADLWAGFLERSVEEAGGPPSRKGSMSSVATGTPRPDTRGG